MSAPACRTSRRLAAQEADPRAVHASPMRALLTHSATLVFAVNFLSSHSSSLSLRTMSSGASPTPKPFCAMAPKSFCWRSASRC